MTGLHQILKDILLTQDSVTVPGLGTFETTYQPARLDEKTGVIYPPTKSVSFNSVLTYEGEEKLIKYLVETAKFSQTEADASIAEFINNVKEKTSQKANFVIDEVGILYADDNGSLCLKAIPSNLSIDNYGMQSVEVAPVDNSQRAKKEASAYVPLKSKHSENQASAGSSTSTQTSTTKTTVTKITETKVTVEKSKNKKKIIILLIVLAVLGAATYFAITNKERILALFHQEDEQIEVPADNSPMLDSSEIEPSEPLDVADSEEKILSDAGFAHITPINLGNNYKRFYLVAGSFTDMRNAKIRVRELKNINLDSEILDAGGRQRVSIGSSDDASGIVARYKDIIAKHPDLDFWLLKNSD